MNAGATTFASTRFRWTFFLVILHLLLQTGVGAVEKTALRWRPAATVDENRQLIEVRGRHQGRRLYLAVDNRSLTSRAGEIVVLLGPDRRPARPRCCNLVMAPTGPTPPPPPPPPPPTTPPPPP